jgi:hypothetical protein
MIIDQIITLINDLFGDLVGDFFSPGLDSNFPVYENFSFYLAGAGSYYSVDRANEIRNGNNLAANMGFNWQSD